MGGFFLRPFTLREKSILGLLFAMSVFFSATCFLDNKGAWAAEKKELVILTVGGSWQEATHAFLGKAFSEKYGVKLTYDMRPNTEQLVALQASKDKPFADVIELAGTRLARAAMMDLLVKQDETKVPNRKFVSAQYKSDYCTDRIMAPITLVYNKEKVDEKDCTSWEVLTNPKYKNRVALMKYGWMGEYFLYAVNKLRGGTYEDVTPGLQFCRKIIENGGIVLQSNDHAMRVLETGELWATPMFTARALMLMKKGVPLKYKFVPGSTFYSCGFCVVNNPQNMDLAYKYVDMSLDPEIQIKFALKLDFTPTNTKVVFPPEAVGGKLNKEDLEKMVDLDFMAMAKESDKNLERFNREVLRQ